LVVRIQCAEAASDRDATQSFFVSPSRFLDRDCALFVCDTDRGLNICVRGTGRRPERRRSSESVQVSIELIDTVSR